MIIFKENGKVFAALSTSEFLPYDDPETDVPAENVPMFRIGNRKTLLAIQSLNGSAIADALRYEKIRVPKDLSERKVSKELLPQIAGSLTKYGRETEDPLSGTITVVLQGTQAFVCFGSGVVYEAGAYHSVGDDDRLEFALLESTKELTGEKRIRKIYRIKEKHFGIRQFPVVYIDTKSCRIHVVNGEKKW